MIYNLSINYQNLNQFTYSKDSYEADFISLYLDEIYKGNVAIFINDDSYEDLEYVILNSKHIYLSELKAINMKGTKTLFTNSLCKCNNCGSVLIDRNPQIGAMEHNIHLDTNKLFVNDDGISVSEMIYLKQPDSENEYFWACPKCETDGYLVDL